MSTLKREQQKASRLINNLTVNEDLRQDLWVAYLSGTPINSLRTKITELLVNYQIQALDRISLELMQADFPPNFFDVFDDVECHTLYLLYSGYNIGEISVTLSISRVTVLDVVSSIKEKGEWSKLWQGSLVKKQVNDSSGSTQYIFDLGGLPLYTLSAFGYSFFCTIQFQQSDI